MRRRRLCALSGALLAGALAGCTTDGDQPATDPPRAVAPGTALPGTVPEIDDEELAELVAETNGLAIDLHQELVSDSPSENLLASPTSITVALAMAYAGARGETREQMRSTLGYTLEDDRLHETFNALQRKLDERGAAAAESDSSGNSEDDDEVPFQLHLVNAVWGQQEYPFEEEYLATLEDHYGGGLREVDYRTDPGAARTEINDWVAEQTAQRIDELLPEGALSMLTRLVLTNAIYFKANWQHPFQDEATTDRAFTALDGSTSDVPMMSLSETVPYAEVDGTAAVELPYVGEDVSMLVVLPPEGEFEEYESSLDRETLGTLTDALEPREGTVSLPRFEFESGMSLKDPLKTLGMPRAFDSNAADFSGIADIEQTGEPLFIDDVYHDTFIAVDEDGTEAAAATAVVVRTESAPLEPFEFVADRPFLFAIRDRPTGSVLFLGRVVDAAAAQ